MYDSAMGIGLCCLLTEASDSALYAHKFQTQLFGNVSNPEEFGFASQYFDCFPFLFLFLGGA